MNVSIHLASMWPSVLTLVMTLTLDFQGEILRWLYLKNGKTD